MKDSKLSKETTKIVFDILKVASKNDPLSLFNHDGTFAENFSKVIINQKSSLLKINEDKIHDIQQVEYDSNDDGIFERKAIFFNGKKIAESIDTNGDKNDEYRFLFQGENNSLSGFAIDINSNGIAECEEEYDGENIIKKEKNDLFGFVLTSIKYNQNGKKESASLDCNNDGVFDYKITYDKNGKPKLDLI